VNWWHEALFDTCSLITLDKMRQDHPEIMEHFTTVLAIEPCLSADQMRIDYSTRLRPIIQIVDLPSPSETSQILLNAHLSISLAQVDQLIYAAAIHYKRSVVTADKLLAKALITAGRRVENMALILKELLLNRSIAESVCGAILVDLAKRQDFILPANDLTCSSLKKYRFP